MKLLASLCAIVIVLALQPAPALIAADQDATVVALPRPDTSGGPTLTQALSRRRSCSAYTDQPLTMQQIGQLCWAARGITEPEKGLRTAPSAMALYSIRVYVVDARGVHEYLPREHGLKTLRTDNILQDLRALPPRPANLGGAPVVMVLGMNLAPLEERTGPRAERYAFMEAGHIAENVLLQAAALGLGSIPVGGFDEAKVAALLKLPEGIRPIYLLPLGVPQK